MQTSTSPTRKQRTTDKVQSFGCETSVAQYVCKYCDFVTDFWIFLQDHIWRYHLPRNYLNTDFKINAYTCNNCDFTSYSLLVQFAHEEAHEDLGYQKITSCYTHSEGAAVKWFKCEECKYKARHKFTLRYHIRAKHRPQHIIQCRHCSYRTAFQNQLKRHIISCHTDPQEISWFKCGQCEHVAKLKYLLTKHINAKHRIQEVKWYTCEQCEYKTNQKYFLNRHISKKHHHGNLLKCSQCSYRTAYHSSLHTHIISRHTDPERISWFKCDQCEYKAKQKGHLKRHVISWHTDPEEISWFECDQCKYKTKRKSHLKIHIGRKHRTEEVE